MKEQGREEGKEGMSEAGRVAEVASSTLMCTHTHTSGTMYLNGGHWSEASCLERKCKHTP